VVFVGFQSVLTTKDEGIGLWKSAIFGCLDPKAQELFVILYSLYIYPVISLCILLKCKHIFSRLCAEYEFFFVGSKIVSTLTLDIMTKYYIK